MSKKKNFSIVSSSGTTLRGMVHHEKEISQCKPVLIVHGYFSANRNGPNRLFVKIADNLASLGFATYRFDLSGMGESDGDINKINFKHHVKDVISVIEFVRKQCGSKQITVIAHSLGCAVVLDVMNFAYKNINKVFLLAPFFSSDKTLKVMLGVGSLEELEKKVPIYRKGLYSDISYFKESLAYDEFVPEINRATGNGVTIYAILGNIDQFVDINEAKELFLKTPKINVIEIDGADHNFLETQKQVISFLQKSI